MSRDRQQVKVLQSQMENVGARARTTSAAAKACRRRPGGRGCPSVASQPMGSASGCSAWGYKGLRAGRNGGAG